PLPPARLHRLGRFRRRLHHRRLGCGFLTSRPRPGDRAGLRTGTTTCVVGGAAARLSPELQPGAVDAIAATGLTAAAERRTPRPPRHLPRLPIPLIQPPIPCAST